MNTTRRFLLINHINQRRFKMNTTRRFLLLAGAALLCAAIAALIVFTASATPETTIPAYTGRGDYQRYEAQFFPANAEAQPARLAIGMGDLRRVEALQDQDATLSQDRPHIGMGDLRRIEAQEANPPTVGMGDLRRVEFQQAVQYAAP